ncbi:unnamed protein product [Plutella xylostella]|uniref:(diamondback moth) hypothetical protein n=1 Tax=Plutella xylostella TaxID=51655 RepID=A0A8S4FVM9_PLUXY|nr:unnamed protein product [Plutella xylostella]
MVGGAEESSSGDHVPASAALGGPRDMNGRYSQVRGKHWMRAASDQEIFKSRTALWMSPDGHMVLYATLNDTLVHEQRLPWYGPALHSDDPAQVRRVIKMAAVFLVRPIAAV